ncbi:MAG: hypothetical protein SV375_23175, partial [Thermodesulfobacteriota bacterium]|nr:hypothetical protein [Thermodesulfobacteriota bacterium]
IDLYSMGIHIHIRKITLQDTPIPPHGMMGVGTQVHQDLMSLGGVCLNGSGDFVYVFTYPNAGRE